jgi:hypothetical protein
VWTGCRRQGKGGGCSYNDDLEERGGSSYDDGLGGAQAAIVITDWGSFSWVKRCYG